MSWFRVSNDVVDKYGAELGAYGLAVYLCIARFTNQEGVSWPSYATLAKRIGISKRKVILEVKKLQELGLLEVTPQFNPETKEHRSNLFTLVDLGGSAHHALGGGARHAPGTARYAPKKDLIKEDTYEERSKKYIPDEYADIILG